MEFLELAIDDWRRTLWELFHLVVIVVGLLAFAIAFH